MITVLNVDGQNLTPCLPHRAEREVNRARAVWIDERTIQLLYNPFVFQQYRKAALKRDHYTCLWCGLPASTVDHIVPSSKGGSDHPRNLLAACSDCNSKRGNRSAYACLKEKFLSVPNVMKLGYRIIKATYSHTGKVLGLRMKAFILR
ncbi:HNH endonuclease [Cohnella candidum]|uniref:HNH endonuclease n=1 Tax=Cohnella candidum TaxID=2674991 RepID=A0A3G3K300_9BACL|nr:HNH endonuclease [Cohnella candidum]AYQ74876.1 HNH endonuclease [Cohnella candidum]